MTRTIALLDSGVNESHPHILGHGEVIHGPVLDGCGEWIDDPEPGDQLGHGTCAAAAILDLAPGSTIYSLKIFRHEPSCPFEELLIALDHAISQEVDWINLSLGTTRPSRASDLESMLARANAQGISVVAPAAIGELACFPGALPGCQGVLVDESLERSLPQQRAHGDQQFWFASPCPRDLPGLPPAANLSGVSLAAANLTGYLASRD
ncbi:MAG: S8 family serine peptidase [Planctomycetota bacterium]|nr:S8 family serine peptidase [Planctomycetota bacterium]